MARETSDSNLSGLQQTPSAQRIHISFFGQRNAGKSSLVNAFTGQSLSIVSEIKGTTTDPVNKAMELLPLGPVMITDTPGLDDKGLVGEKRVEKTFQVLRKTDAAVLVIDLSVGICENDLALAAEFRKRKIPFIAAFNKADAVKHAKIPEDLDFPGLLVSAKIGLGILDLKEKLAEITKPVQMEKAIIGDRLNPADVVVLVTPIDSSAPKGRLILPQVQTIRDILDRRAVCLVTQTEQLPSCLSALKNPPALVITDSQVFQVVKDMVPKTVKLTSFSILMARLKGILEPTVRGAHALDKLQDGDTVLISEGCTHHRQCEDIGTVKLPGWIESYTGKKLQFVFTSGGEFPEDLSPYALLIHCGGCMLNQREMQYRMHCAAERDIPFTNYGILIAQINGILDRSIEIFSE